MNAPTIFKFTSHGYPPETFDVISFTGEEALSETYEFNINLATPRPIEVMDRMLEHPATFIIRQGGVEFPYHGIVINIDQVNQVKDYTFYQIVLVPRMYRLHYIRHNQVFLDQTIPRILEDLLVEAGLTPDDFEFRLQGDPSLYRVREMVSQYNQTHFDFFSFWAETMGLYFYFEQGRTSEKLIVTDTNMAHTSAPREPHLGPEQASLDDTRMIFATPSGLGHEHTRDFIFHLRHRLKKVPGTVVMKDSFDQKPSLDLTVTSPVAAHGEGLVNIHGDLAHYHSPEEGRLLSSIRAQELRCKENLYTGLSYSARLRTGYVFSLSGHFQERCNQKYMTIQVSHSGSQSSHLTGGLKKAVRDLKGGPLNVLTMTLKRIFLSQEESPAYENRFIAIPARVQFRPERKTEPSRIWGNLSAVIDGSGNGQYAELDEQGRYKVILPFDSSGRKDLKASAWIRMSQPTGGGRQGMHFPLRPGTEVLLSFLSGDPNRPVIVGAVPNPQNPNIVTSKNLTRGGIQSASGHQLVMDDTDGNGYIALSTGNGKSFIALGSSGTASVAENADSTGPDEAPDPEIQEESTNEGAGNYWSYVFGDSTDYTLGAKNSITVGTKSDIFVGAKSSISVAAATDLFVGLKSAVEASLSNKWSLAGSSDYSLSAKVSMGASRTRSISKNHDVLAKNKVTLAGGAESVAAGTVWTTIAATLGSLLAEASGAGLTYSSSSWSTLLTDTSFFESNPVEAGVSTGLSALGTAASVVGLTAAEVVMLAALTTIKSTAKTATLELDGDGMKVDVQPPSTGSPAIDLTCKDLLGNNKSNLTLKSDSTKLLCESLTSMGSTSMETDSGTLKIKREDDFGDKSTIKVDSGITLTVDAANKFETKIDGDSISLSQANSSNKIVMDTNSIELKYGSTSITLDGCTIKLGANTLKDKAGALSIDSMGNVSLG